MPINPIVLMYTRMKNFYIPITISNNQNISTSAPFQQLITINPSLIGSNLFSSDLGNIRFYADYAFTQPLYAWVESGNSNTSTATNIWVKLPNGIPANSSITIYMRLESVGTEYDGVYMGEAPQLSSTYAQFDNGANVFNFYDNFAGTTLSSKWVSGTNGGTATINNGLSLIVPATVGDYVYIASASKIASQPIIVETYMNGNSLWLAGYRLGFGLVSSQTYLLPSGVSQDHVSWQGTELSPTEIVATCQIGTAYSIPTGVNPVDGNYHIWGLEWLSGIAGFWYDNYSAVTTITSDIPTDTTYLTLSYYAYASLQGTPTALKFLWTRTRAYPPNGVMPSISVGII
ncbi:MAG: DUF2341 domain-containing protein [Saccharolobus sp.]